jgi:hypothetical protein
MAIQMTLGQQTVVKRFGLEVTRDNKGNHRVEDRFIAQFYIGSNDPSKRGVYVHHKLDAAIQAAVAFRKEHDAEMSRRSGFSTDPVVKPKTKAVVLDTVTPAPTLSLKSVEAVGLGNPPPVTPHKFRVMIDESPLTANGEDIEFDDVELDNTGIRVTKPKEPPRRSKSDSMYLSATRVLVNHPHIGQEALAKQAVLAMESAFRCQVAFYDILTILDDEHCLNAAGKRLLEALPKPKKEKA